LQTKDYKKLPVGTTGGLKGIINAAQYSVRLLSAQALTQLVTGITWR